MAFNDDNREAGGRTGHPNQPRYQYSSAHQECGGAPVREPGTGGSGGAGQSNNSMQQHHGHHGGGVPPAGFPTPGYGRPASAGGVPSYDYRCRGGSGGPNPYPVGQHQPSQHASYGEDGRVPHQAPSGMSGGGEGGETPKPQSSQHGAGGTMSEAADDGSVTSNHSYRRSSGGCGAMVPDQQQQRHGNVEGSAANQSGNGNAGMSMGPQQQHSYGSHSGGQQGGYYQGPPPSNRGYGPGPVPVPSEEQHGGHTQYNTYGGSSGPGGAQQQRYNSFEQQPQPQPQPQGAQPMGGAHSIPPQQQQPSSHGPNGLAPPGPENNNSNQAPRGPYYYAQGPPPSSSSGHQYHEQQQHGGPPEGPNNGNPSWGNQQQDNQGQGPFHPQQQGQGQQGGSAPQQSQGHPAQHGQGGHQGHGWTNEGAQQQQSVPYQQQQQQYGSNSNPSVSSNRPPSRQFPQVVHHPSYNPMAMGMTSIGHAMTAPPGQGAGGCTCKKSQCLKLYCQCFASSSVCNPRKCKCQSCHNTHLHGRDIEDARRVILERNPTAFEDKFRSEVDGHHHIIGAMGHTNAAVNHAGYPPMSSAPPGPVPRVALSNQPPKPSSYQNQGGQHHGPSPTPGGGSNNGVPSGYSGQPQHQSQQGSYQPSQSMQNQQQHHVSGQGNGFNKGYGGPQGHQQEARSQGQEYSNQGQGGGGSDDRSVDSRPSQQQQQGMPNHQGQGGQRPTNEAPIPQPPNAPPHHHHGELQGGRGGPPAPQQPPHGQHGGPYAPQQQHQPTPAMHGGPPMAMPGGGTGPGPYPHQHHQQGGLPSVVPPMAVPVQRTHKLGCKCRKSHCLKKYCECFHHGAKCGGNCRCVNCRNRPEPGNRGGSDEASGTQSALERRKASPSIASRAAVAPVPHPQPVQHHQQGPQPPSSYGNSPSDPPSMHAGPSGPPPRSVAHAVSSRRIPPGGGHQQLNRSSSGGYHVGQGGPPQQQGGNGGPQPRQSNQQGQPHHLLHQQQREGIQQQQQPHIHLPSLPPAPPADYYTSGGGDRSGGRVGRVVKHVILDNGQGYPQAQSRHHRQVSDTAPPAPASQKSETQRRTISSAVGDAPSSSPKKESETKVIAQAETKTGETDKSGDSATKKDDSPNKDNRMAMMAALAMTELLGDSTRASSTSPTSPNKSSESKEGSEDGMGNDSLTRQVSESPSTTKSANASPELASKKRKISIDGEGSASGGSKQASPAREEPSKKKVKMTSSPYKKDQAHPSSTSLREASDESAQVNANLAVVSSASCSPSIASTSTIRQSNSNDTEASHGERPVAIMPTASAATGTHHYHQQQQHGHNIYRPHAMPGYHSGHGGGHGGHPAGPPGGGPSGYHYHTGAPVKEMTHHRGGMGGHHHHGGHPQYGVGQPMHHHHQQHTGYPHMQRHSPTGSSMPGGHHLHGKVVSGDGGLSLSSSSCMPTPPSHKIRGPINKEEYNIAHAAAGNHNSNVAQQMQGGGGLHTIGLPKSLSFRKICSKCGKTRGEHGELGFGNKCVYQDCGKCGAGVQMHVKANVPMGFACTLTPETGATPGAAEAYNKKIRELAERAALKNRANANAAEQAVAHAQDQQQKQQEAQEERAHPVAV